MREEVIKEHAETPMIEIVRTMEQFIDDKEKRKEEAETFMDFIDMAGWLDTKKHFLHYGSHKYATGENLIATIGKAPFIGIGSHYDTVRGTPGANDNASAMAVTLDLLRRFSREPPKNIGIRGFFFDEEENGLRGSRAYVRERGFADMIGFYNMELVGSGDRLALWAEGNIYRGALLKAIKESASVHGVPMHQFPGISAIMSNSGDQESFLEAGMREVFCVTAISERDVDLAQQISAFRKIPPYTKENYIADSLVPGGNTLRRISRSFNSLLHGARVYRLMSKTDLFKHYHKPSDTSEHLSEKTLQTVSDVLWESIKAIDTTFTP